MVPHEPAAQARPSVARSPLLFPYPSSPLAVPRDPTDPCSWLVLPNLDGSVHGLELSPLIVIDGQVGAHAPWPGTAVQYARAAWQSRSGTFFRSLPDWQRWVNLPGAGNPTNAHERRPIPAHQPPRRRGETCQRSALPEVVGTMPSGQCDAAAATAKSPPSTTDGPCRRAPDALHGLAVARLPLAFVRVILSRLANAGILLRGGVFRLPAERCAPRRLEIAHYVNRVTRKCRFGRPPCCEERGTEKADRNFIANS